LIFNLLLLTALLENGKSVSQTLLIGEPYVSGSLGDSREADEESELSSVHSHLVARELLCQASGIEPGFTSILPNARLQSIFGQLAKVVAHRGQLDGLIADFHVHKLKRARYHVMV
jgi:hypothetical protein